MAVTVCLLGNCLHYPQGGGHFWVYLNWALGLRALGCKVLWLEVVDSRLREAERDSHIREMRSRLEQVGLEDALCLTTPQGADLAGTGLWGCLDLAAASEADLLLNMVYAIDASIVSRFRRTALLDIDPGLLQLWITQRTIGIARHDRYFTIGETVGEPTAKFPSGGLPWMHTRPCVATAWWPVSGGPEGAPFTSISHWNTGDDEWMEDSDGPYNNDKREGFRPFLDLPAHTRQRLELALALGGDEKERNELERRGWSVQEAWEISATPWSYQDYIRRSAGEFSCAKPSCVRLQNAWISDRTLCYLASGKPAVVQHTGPSKLLPDAEGLFRFRTFEEAVRHLEQAAVNYRRHAQRARELVETHFDAAKVAASLLERALA